MPNTIEFRTPLQSTTAASALSRRKLPTLVDYDATKLFICTFALVQMCDTLIVYRQLP
jgi:hypothetical protein